MAEHRARSSATRSRRLLLFAAVLVAMLLSVDATSRRRARPAAASSLLETRAEESMPESAMQPVMLVDRLEGSEPQPAKLSSQVEFPFKPEVTIVNALPPESEANSPATDSENLLLPRFVERLRSQQPQGAHVYRNSLDSLQDNQEEKEYQQQLGNLTQGGKRVFQAQLAEVEKCYNVLFNFTAPAVYNRDFFPKRDGAEHRFRFHCMSRKTINGTSVPSFLSSYNIDGFYIPEWVAFRIERPVFGYSLVPNTDKKSCAQKGFPEEFFSVKHNDITTPDKAFLVHKNAQLKRSGVSSWQNLRAGQLLLPTDFVDCGGKFSTYALTNVVPMNKYMFENNWARADRAMRQYVAGEVKKQPVGAEATSLEASAQYHPLFAVAGVHYSTPKLDRVSWAYSGENVQDPAQTKHVMVPQAVWMAVLDTRKIIAKKPELAAVAWYCDNSYKGPWPQSGENMYDNGPKLCKVMSLSKLRQVVGIAPFPDLPLAALDARPLSAQWFLADEF